MTAAHRDDERPIAESTAAGGQAGAAFGFEGGFGFGVLGGRVAPYSIARSTQARIASSSSIADAGRRV
jgi:hypothetical protein